MQHTVYATSSLHELTMNNLHSVTVNMQRYVMLWCRAIMDEIGNHLMPEQSVLCSPDDLSVSGSLCPLSM